VKVFLCVSVLAVASCGGKDRAPTEPAADPQQSGSVDPVEALDDLIRAAKTRGPWPHRFAGQSKVVVSEDGKELEALDETATIESGGGALHATYTNSKDYGRELYYAAAASGGTVWVRPRYGKFHKRPPADPDEPARVAGEIYGTLAADLELVAGYATLTDQGNGKIALALGPKRQRPPSGSWRDAAVVTALEGEITLDPASHTVLTGRLGARVTFTREGHAYEMTLAAAHSVTDVNAAITVAPPDDKDSVATPERSTEVQERKELLDGLAAPPAKGKK
jgi:hypothetical protein